MTTEKICGNCHFFGRTRKGIDDQYIAYFDEHDGLSLRDLRICGYVEHFCIHRSDDKLPPNIPVVTDSSGYYAALRVPSDFGCVKWQPVEDNPHGQIDKT